MKNPLIPCGGDVFVRRVPVGSESQVGILRIHHLQDRDRRVVDQLTARAETTPPAIRGA